MNYISIGGNLDADCFEEDQDWNVEICITFKRKKNNKQFFGHK